MSPPSSSPVQGQTVRLRFAETDNVNFFNFGVDNVTVNIPAPSALALGLP
jgi:hypothetical protein